MLDAVETHASLIHPFVGLRPFAYEDGDFFFGQEELVDTLERLVTRGRMLSVVGSSGSGKSSLVRAGLLPRLGADRQAPGWSWVEMRPGESPIRNLADALARPNISHQLHRVSELTLAKGARIEHTLQQSSFGITEAVEQFKLAEDRRILIVVDQFEEIFRFADLRAQRVLEPRRIAEQRDEATSFIQLLLNAARNDQFPGSLVITMRSDFIGECARFYGLSELVTETQFLVPGLTRDQRSRAIRGPIERAKGEIEPTVVQRLLNDSDDDPDQLPVMQHVLMRCWNRAIAGHPPGSPTKLTMPMYEEVGGFEGALTQHGDEMLRLLANREAEVSATGRSLAEITKRVFQCLTDTDSEGRTIRRPQTLDDLVSVLSPEDDTPVSADEEQTDAGSARQRATTGIRLALEQATRLVVLHFANPTCSFLRSPAAEELRPSSIIDIGHEALIRRWEKLGSLDARNWVRDEQADAENYRTLLRYEYNKDIVPRRQYSHLLRWWNERRPTRFWARRYSQAGRERLDDARMALDRSRRYFRRERWSRGIVWGVIVGLLIGIGIWRVLSLREAAEEQARNQALLIAVEGTDELRLRAPYEALLLAKYGLDPAKTELAANKALAYEALSRMRELSIFSLPERRGGTLAMAPNGNLITYAGGRNLTFWDLDTSKAVQTTPGPDMAWAPFISAHPGGNYVVVSGQGDKVELVRITHAAEPEHPIPVVDRSGGGETANVGMGVFSPDGKILATVGRNNAPLRLWPLLTDADGRLTIGDAGIPVYDGKAIQSGTAASISADSKTIAIGLMETGDVLLYSLDGSAAPLKIPYPANAVDRDQARSRAANPSSPEQSETRPAVMSLTFHPRDPDQLLVTYSGDARPHIWNLRTNEVRILELGRTSNFTRAVWSPDGRYIAMTAMPDGERVRVWDLQIPDKGRPQLPTWIVQGSDGQFFNAIFDQKDRLVAGSIGGTIWVWDVEPALSRGLDKTDDTAAPLRSESGTTTLERDSDGGLLIHSNVRGVANGRIISLARFFSTQAQSTISPDGRWAMATPAEGPILLFDLSNPEDPVAVFGRQSSRWTDVRFGSHMDRVLATDSSGTAQTWRIFTNSESMRAFIDRSLPQVCGQQAALSEQMQSKLSGEFWSVLMALKGGAPPAAFCKAGAT